MRFLLFMILTWQRVFLRDAFKHLGSQIMALIACGVLAIYVEGYFNQKDFVLVLLRS